MILNLLKLKEQVVLMIKKYSLKHFNNCTLKLSKQVYKTTKMEWMALLYILFHHKSIVMSQIQKYLVLENLKQFNFNFLIQCKKNCFILLIKNKINHKSWKNISNNVWKFTKIVKKILNTLYITIKKF